MKVLLVVDVQRDFCPGGALPVPEGDSVVPVVNALLRSGRYDLHVASLDWHPTDHVSFADNHPGKKLFEVVSVNGVSQVLWPRHCVQGSPGSELHPEIEQERIHHQIQKGMRADIDSYSAFFDNAKTAQTPLWQLLVQHASERGERTGDIEIDIVGLATDYCVGATAIDALAFGCKVRVLIDGCRAVNVSPGDDATMLRAIVERGGEVSQSSEVLGRRVVREREKDRSERGVEV